MIRSKVAIAVILASVASSCSDQTPPPRRTSSSSTVAGLSSLAGTYRFVPRGVERTSPLPPGALRGPHDDLVIRGDGRFTWGAWTGSVEGSPGFLILLVTHPTRSLWRSFDRAGLSIGIAQHGRNLLLWLPDLGIDRDVDRGVAVGAGADIDPPDMLFHLIRGDRAGRDRSTPRSLGHGTPSKDLGGVEPFVPPE